MTLSTQKSSDTRKFRWQAEDLVFPINAKDYQRALTPAERRVDYAAIKKIFDEDALATGLVLRGFIKATEAALIHLIEQSSLSAEFTQSLRLDTGRELSKAVNDYLLDVWRRNRDLAIAELPEQLRTQLEGLRRYTEEQYAFCPTGEGGGIDNSCSPSGGEPGGGVSKTPLDSIERKLGVTVDEHKIDSRVKEDPDIDLIANRGQFLSTDGITIVKGRKHQCHGNAARLYRQGKIDFIVTGYADGFTWSENVPIDKRDPKESVWFQHSWGIKDNNIVETTSNFSRYYGVVLTKEESAKFAKRYVGKDKIPLGEKTKTGIFEKPKFDQEDEHWSVDKLDWQSGDKKDYASSFRPDVAVNYLRNRALFIKGLIDDFTQSLKLDTGRELSRAVNDYLLDVWRRNRDLAITELPEQLRTQLEGLRRYAEEQYAFCPTGEGGGIDNSCSPTGENNGTDSNIVFKGTSVDVVKSIKANGLKRGPSQAGRPPSVYYTTNENHARLWGSLIASFNKKGTAFAVVEFSIPTIEQGISDELHPMQDAFRLERDIPASWIKGIKVYDPKAGKVVSVLARQEPSFYTVVFIEQDEDKKDYAQSFRPDVAVNYLRNRALFIKGLIDDELTRQVKYQVFEHLKGGRTLSETIGNLREVFEPWVGDPEKIIPSGISRTPEDILRAYRLETIIRTETATAMNLARTAVADAAEDFVLGYQYSAILDLRTCFKKNTKVKLANGKWRSIEYIKPGDEVVTASGHVNKVVACWRYVAPTWRVLTFSDGTKITCTPTHPFWVRNGTSYSWIEAHALGKGTTVAVDGSIERICDNNMHSMWPAVPPLQMFEAQVLLNGMLHQMGKCVLRKEETIMPAMQEAAASKMPNQQVLLDGMPPEVSYAAKSEIALQGVQKGILSERKEFKQKILQYNVLLQKRQAQSESVKEMPGMRQTIFNRDKIYSSSSDLLRRMQTYTQAKRCSSKVGYSGLHRVWEAAYPSIEALSHGPKDSLLFLEVPSKETKDTMPYVRKVFLNERAIFLRKEEQYPNFLFGEMLSCIPSAYEYRTDGSKSLDSIEYSLQEGICNNEEINSGFFAKGLQNSVRNGRGILASTQQEPRRTQRRNSYANGISSNQVQLQFGQSAGSRFTAYHSNHTSEPIRGGGCVTVLTNEPIAEFEWAYDIEVENDHTYIAEGLFVHNTELCAGADGITFRKDDARAVKLTPPLHWQCRSLLTYVTTNDVPVEWTSEEDLDAVVRDIPKEFK